MKSIKHWVKVEILFLSDTIRNGVCVTSGSRLFSTVRDRGFYQIGDLAQYRYNHIVHRSTTQGALWSIGAKSMPLLNTRGASYNSVAGSARCSGQTHVIETNGTLKNWFQYFSNLFLRRIPAETCLDRSLGKWWNRAGIHEVVFLLAFFIFPFPLFRFAISLFLAIKIFWLLLQNCAPVKQTQG